MEVQKAWVHSMVFWYLARPRSPGCCSPTSAKTSLNWRLRNRMQSVFFLVDLSPLRFRASFLKAFAQSTHVLAV
eukprot:3663317-Prorocentrum_lima.AAC.1